MKTNALFFLEFVNAFVLDVRLHINRPCVAVVGEVLDHYAHQSTRAGANAASDNWAATFVRARYTRLASGVEEY